MADQTTNIQFHYKKSPLFRVVHSDGSWGGITPELNLFLTFFSQRPPIPEMVVQSILPDGTLGPELAEARISKSGIVREVEIGVVMSTDSVDQLIIWLQKQQTILKKLKLNDSKEPAQNEPRDADSATVS